MYKFAISYYTMEGNERKPQSGVDIRLLRPGQSWAEVKHLIEPTPNLVYYEIGIEAESDCGFYEIWDNIGSTQGQFSCSIPHLQLLFMFTGVKDSCFPSYHPFILPPFHAGSASDGGLEPALEGM